MWIFTKLGFFSVVQHNENDSWLLVRARAKGDIERLLGELTVGLPAMVVEHTPQADYPFRAVVSREHFAALMQLAVDGLDYPNFKDKIGQTEPLRAMAYHRVWAELIHLESEAPAWEALLPALRPARRRGR